MNEVTQLQIVRDDAPSCVHHWVLTDPDTGAVSGRCRRCGGERVFCARPEGVARFDDLREFGSTPNVHAADRVG